MHNQNNIKETLSGHQFIPVVTFGENDDPIKFMDFLLKQNINCIEVTLRSNAGLKAIKKLKKENYSGVLIGAGTVTSCQQVEQLEALDADFMVSPGVTSKLQKHMGRSSIPYLPGVATPSEIIKAKEMGLSTLKFFPANLFGGLDALKAYQAIFPDISFCPTGGITKISSEEYLKMSNVFAVGGSWFQKEYSQR